MLFSGDMVRALLDGSKTQTRRLVKPQSPTSNELCPYGQPGDLLWVRETWNRTNPGGDSGVYYFRADTRFPDELGGRPYTGEEQWRPSIHMPRSASRIALEVTGTRIERLQDISESDVVAEGVKLLPNGLWGGKSGSVWKDCTRGVCLPLV